MKSITIKNPKNTKLLIGMFILAAVQVNSIIRGFRRHDLDAFFYIGIGLLVLFMTLFIFLFMKRIEKPSAITFGTDELIVHDHSITAETIDQIYVEGYFNPLIGIRRKGKKIVFLAFRFIEDEDKAIKELKEWAESHHIGVHHKTFIRWI
ncbi:MAG: hypothetical protein ACE3L7_20860 [Candidatus Pristimantibacillus sp.]